MEEINLITQIIRNRRSVFPKSYNGKEIPRELLQEILDNANYAPSHKLTQPWYFKVFRKQGLNTLAEFVAEHYKLDTPTENFLQSKYDAMHHKIVSSSCVIAIVAKFHADKVPEWEEIASVACAVQNMWLTASAMKIGSYWSTPGAIKSMHDLLTLGENERCIGLFYMGYYDELPAPVNRMNASEKITWFEN